MTIADLSDFPKKLLGEITVVNRIEAMLEDMNLEPSKIITPPMEFGDEGRREDIFHSSQIALKSGVSLNGKYPMGCGRQLFYSYTGEPGMNAFQPRLRRIFDTGTAIHTQLQSYLTTIAANDPNFDFHLEADIDPDVNHIADVFDLSGHVDGVITVTAGKHKVRFGLEIKSINDAGYKGTNGVHPEHKIQGTIYQRCLDLPYMLFLYYNKNDSNMVEFIEPFDPYKWDEVEKKINMVRSCVFNGELPPRETSFACKTCKWQKPCDPPKKMKAAKARAIFRK